MGNNINHTLAIFPNYIQNDEHKPYGNMVVSEVSVLLGYDASLMCSRFPMFRDQHFDSRCRQLSIQTRGVIYRRSGNLRHATAKTIWRGCISYVYRMVTCKVSLQTTDSSYYTKGQVLEVHKVSEYIITFPDLIMKDDCSPDLTAGTTYDITGLHP